MVISQVGDIPVKNDTGCLVGLYPPLHREDGSKIVALSIGGDDKEGKVSKKVSGFDENTNEWVKLNKLPEASRHPTCVCVQLSTGTAVAVVGLVRRA